MEVEKETMGKVIAHNVVLKNNMDENAKTLGLANHVRQITTDMIVDTGAVVVSLPEKLVLELGLPFSRKAKTRGDNGKAEWINLYSNLLVEIDDREAITQCIGIPNDNAPCLLGQLVLEQIDYVVDCKRQRLIPNPEEVDGVMIIEMY